MIMETYTIEDIKNKVYGEIGTPRRDKIETELSNLRVGLQIRNAREARNLTQDQLAKKIGKERSFISKVEREGSNLTLSTLYDIVTKGLGGKLDIRVQVYPNPQLNSATPCDNRLRMSRIILGTKL